MAYVLRVHLFKFKLKQDVANSKKFLEFIGEISASEYRDAWMYLIHYDQETKLIEKKIQRLVPVQIEVKLENYDFKIQHTIIGGRVKNFPVSFSKNSNIPILPASALGKLVVLHYHNKFHKEIDTIVAHTRNDIWVVNCRKIGYK